MVVAKCALVVAERACDSQSAVKRVVRLSVGAPQLAIAQFGFAVVIV